jgi:hypothetical protein
MFKNNAIFLIVTSAILIPLMFITSDIISLATLAALFVIAQMAMLYFFYKEREAKLEQWYAFWTAILSLGYMLYLVLTGRSLLAEFLGLLLFIIYFIGLIMLLFREKLQLKPRKAKTIIKEESRLEEYKEEDYESFREKDELDELVDFFEPDHRSEYRVIKVPEPKIEKIVYDVVEEEKPKTRKESEEYKEIKVKKTRAEKKAEEEEWKEIEAELPRSVVFDYNAEYAPPETEIREAAKPTPRVNFEKVKQDLEKIDDGVKTISEKIRLISEKAILEGAEKKLRDMERKKQPKPKKKELKVFASKTGNKFHYKRNCLALKRVKTKDVESYTNSEAARKKGLKPCGMCK